MGLGLGPRIVMEIGDHLCSYMGDLTFLSIIQERVHSNLVGLYPYFHLFMIKLVNSVFLYLFVTRNQSGYQRKF